MDPLKFVRSWRSESGAELVEFAISFPLLLLVTMGLMDFGLAFQRYEVLTNAAREGARVSVAAAPAPVYFPDDIIARVEQYITGTSLTPDSVTTTVGPAQVLNVTPTRCISVRPVTVTYDHQFMFVGGIMGYFGSSLGTRTLTATASMRSELGSVTCP